MQQDLILLIIIPYITDLTRNMTGIEKSCWRETNLHVSRLDVMSGGIALHCILSLWLCVTVQVLRTTSCSARNRGQVYQTSIQCLLS